MTPDNSTSLSMPPDRYAQALRVLEALRALRVHVSWQNDAVTFGKNLPSSFTPLILECARELKEIVAERHRQSHEL